jgi:hypothetical protein
MVLATGSDPLPATNRGPEEFGLDWPHGPVLNDRAAPRVDHVIGLVSGEVPMHHRTAPLCLIAIAMACAPEHAFSPQAPPQVPATVPTAPTCKSANSTSTSANTTREIAVGDVVNDVLVAHGTEHTFSFTAPSTGTVKLRLTWDRSCGFLDLWVANAWLTGAPGSTIDASLPVLAGQRYSVRVADAAPWDYDVLWLPFALATSIKSD